MHYGILFPIVQVCVHVYVCLFTYGHVYVYMCLYVLKAEVRALWYSVTHTTGMCACICMFVHVRNVHVCM